MEYFSLVHILVIIFILMLFFVFLFLASKIKDSKTALSYVILNAILMAVFLILGMLLSDQYTKKAQILNLKTTRVFMNETLRISGELLNIGGYDITFCNIKIKLVNSPTNLQDIDPDLFKPKTLWENFFKPRKKSSVSTVETEHKVDGILKAGQKVPFSFSMTYPAKFKQPRIHHTISCH